MIKDEFKKAYQKSFAQKFCCSKKIIDQKFLYQGNHKVKFSFPDHPDNLFWENMEYNNSFRNK